MSGGEDGVVWFLQYEGALAGLLHDLVVHVTASVLRGIPHVHRVGAFRAIGHAILKRMRGGRTHLIRLNAPCVLPLPPTPSSRGRMSHFCTHAPMRSKLDAEAAATLTTPRRRADPPPWLASAPLLLLQPRTPG